jgi:O-antigen/teichoic acid export membrane protein
MANWTLGEIQPIGRTSGLWWRGRRILNTVVVFFVGQGALQGINILIGLYLVRVLSVESYAQFGLTQGFQQTVGLLMDLGFASTIIPLVGNRGDDRGLVGSYVRAAKHLRDRAFWILAPVATVIFVAIMRHHHWNWYIQAILIGSVLVSIYSSGKVSYYSAPLFLYGKLKQYYLPQTVVSAVRLLIVLAMRVVGALNGWTAAITSALSITLNGESLQRECRNHIEWPESDDPVKNKEVLRYVLPAVPAMAFAAFQMQSSVFLISIFGQTSGIAQVSALGRLGQLFGILSVFNAVVVEPSMARLAREKVAGRFALLILIGVLVCAPVVILAFVSPGPVLWVLGSKYRELTRVVGWAMLTGSLNYLSMLIWIMNRSRKWIFWSGTALEIALTLLMQAVFLIEHGVRTTSDAVFFGLVTAIGPLITHIYVMFFGLFRSRSEQRPRIAVSSV